MKRKPFPIGLSDAQAETEFIEWWNAYALPRFKHRAKYVAAGLPLAAHLQAQWQTFDDLALLWAELRPDGQERLVQRLGPWWNSLRHLEDKIRKRAEETIREREANGAG